MRRRLFLVTICLLLLCVFPVYGKEKSALIAVQGSESPSASSKHEVFKAQAASVKYGFRIENGETYYYKSGAKVTGWQKINRNGVDCWHYFDQSGAMVKGFFEINGKEYFFKSDGTMAHDSMEEYNGVLFYFDSDGQKKTGWQFVNGSWYYFNLRNGESWCGPLYATKVDPNNYFFWTDGYTDKNGNSGQKGTLAWGEPYIEIYYDGKLVHVADGEGHLLANVILTHGSEEYEFDAEGNVVRPLFEKKVEEIKQMFPVNGYWQHNGSNSPWTYISTPSGKDNEFDYSWQCNGFAKYIFYYVYGMKSTSLYDPYRNISTSKVRVGDYLRIGNNEHSIFITNIYTDSEGKTHWEVAREVWGTQNSIIKSCNYTVVDDTRIQYGNRTYVIDAIRRADNSLRRAVGLEDAEKLQ